MSDLTAILTQHPVGQGGMMSGRLEIPGGRFHWVYDCGSNQKDTLTREIRNVAAVGGVDCLFLSHLDSDHVNGIDQLLASVPVKEVVLPYLNNIGCFLIAARDTATRTITGTLIALLADIPAWFGSRGVERVTFIEPRSDDEGGDGIGPDLPDGGGMDGGREGQINAKWSRKDQRSPRVIVYKEARSGPIVQYMDRRATLQFNRSDGFLLDWVIVPYAHRPSDNRMKEFRTALQDTFGQSALKDDFWISALRDSNKREKLRDCYDVIWSDHNLISMALYAGPVSANSWTSHRLIRHDHSIHMSSRAEIGWLGTGDMHLDVKVRRMSFLKHYDRLLPQVNVFGLPHHGSHLNFDRSLPDAMPNARQFVAAAGPNSYDHPSKLVKNSVHSAKREFVHVSHRGGTKLQWEHSS